MSDGQFYRIFIDPLLEGVHKELASNIRKGDRLLDIACGNGSLAIIMSANASSVTAIDISKESVNYARKRIIKKDILNVEFIQMDASDLSSLAEYHFDTAVLSMAVHQFSYDIALGILEELKRITDKVLILDYQYPLKGLGGGLARIIEWMAGKEHHSNFKVYMTRGGLPALLDKAGYETINIYKEGRVFTIHEALSK